MRRLQLARENGLVGSRALLSFCEDGGTNEVLSFSLAHLVLPTFCE